MSNILIEANNISKIYDQDMYLKRGINFYALHHVDFIVERGDFITVMGPSGSGKSTLMNCISTLDKVSSGKLEILQKPVLAMKEDELSDFRRNYLGFIFQNHHLISSLTIFDNIATPLILNKNNPKDTKARVEEVSRKLNIENLMNVQVEKNKEPPSLVPSLPIPLFLFVMNQRETWIVKTLMKYLLIFRNSMRKERLLF